MNRYTRLAAMAAVWTLGSGLAWADSGAANYVQEASRHVQDLSVNPKVPPATLNSLENTVRMMAADQNNPAIFAVDQRIYEAQLRGVAEATGQSAEHRTQALQHRLTQLNQESQQLQAEYTRLRQQLAQKTMANAQAQRLQREIQQQKQTLQQEEQNLQSLSPSASTTPAPAAAPPPKGFGALSAFGSTRQGKDGFELDLPVTQLFAQGDQLSASGSQSLHALASRLTSLNASAILVRVAAEPGGINLATQRAERILRSLRQGGVPDGRLALASGAGVRAGQAQILLMRGS